MNSDIQKILIDSPFLAIFAVLWAGMLASVGSCTLIRFPLIFGYIAGYSDSKRKGIFLLLFFVIGLILSYTISGILLGLIGNFSLKLVGLGKLILWILGALLIVIGFLITGLFGLKRLDLHSNKLKVINAIVAFILGVFLALIEMPPCPDEPTVPMIIASTVFVGGSHFYAIVAFISFAIGQSIPLFLIGRLTSLVKYLIPKAEKYEPIIRLVAGGILIAIGIYFVIIA